LKEVDLDVDSASEKELANFRVKVAKLRCLVVMSGGKKRAALQNLLQAFGIRSEIVNARVTSVSPNSFAVVESSSKGITLACEIQQVAPNCRCIILESTQSVLTPAAIESRIRSPLFIVQPVTVKAPTGTR